VAARDARRGFEAVFPGSAEHQLGCFVDLRRLGAELVLGVPGKSF
jgi:hypothetical protein